MIQKTITFLILLTVGLFVARAMSNGGDPVEILIRFIRFLLDAAERFGHLMGKLSLEFIQQQQ